MWRCASAVLVLFYLNAIAASTVTTNDNSICSHPFCECIPAEHPSWTMVNCSLPRDQSLNVIDGYLPEATIELVLQGGKEVVLAVDSLSRLRGMKYIYVAGAQQLIVRKHAAMALNIVSLIFKVTDCYILRIEPRAFLNIKGPITANISRCGYVTIGTEAFSWLLSLSISNIQHLELSSGAFMLDSDAANIGDHGPGLKIELKKVITKEFPQYTFGSSAAEIVLENVEVKSIEKNAFSANTYVLLLAKNSTVQIIKSEAVAQKTFIKHLQFHGSKVQEIETKALQSAIQNFTIINSSIDMINEGAIKITVATVIIEGSNFSTISPNGLHLSSWNKFTMRRNKFRNLETTAITSSTNSLDELNFIQNAIHKAHKDSLSFIGQASSHHTLNYQDNYFAETCHCNIKDWLAIILTTEDTEYFASQSFCTIGEFLARCFNKPEQNMLVDYFIEETCNNDPEIRCQPFKTKTNGIATEIKNPIFPDKADEEGTLSSRNAKVIAIILITVFSLVLIVMFITLIKWMRRKGYCLELKNFVISANGSCCDRLCGLNTGMDNARSISQMSVNEYSERHRLNEPRTQDMIQETAIPDMYTETPVLVEDKTTQTLPEELTKELLESLREKLDDPENYVEAREMIEHLYELIKVEESCNNTPSPNLMNVDENIYELPFQNTAPRIGKNKKKMISVGTRAPSLDKLSPLSPYNGKTALSHEYFEPKDFAVHLYAEIANCDKDKKNLVQVMPDVVGEQAMPRGPYLRAVRGKGNESTPSSPPKASSFKPQSPKNTSTIKSNSSNSSSKMLNRPLPEKPTTFDPGEGTSCKRN